VQLNEGDAALLAAVRAGLGAEVPKRLGVAVSGGGDSVALLHVLSRCFPGDEVQLFAATVDHGLRPEAAAEAVAVQGLAATLGIPHTTLNWRGWTGEGNLQDAARRARYGLLAEWAITEGLGAVTLGHTADDQAETVLMRLARSAGVDGLSAMRASRVVECVTFLRPLLDVTRAELRDYLRRNEVSWVDDPSNEDMSFDRVRARKALARLEETGITVRGLAEVARQMAEARDALDRATWNFSLDHVHIDAGAVVIETEALRTLPDELARRLLVRALSWVGDAEYPPRRAPVAETLAVARGGGTLTLAGCRILHHGEEVWICRELNAVAKEVALQGELWDRRWRLSGPGGVGCDVRALGEDGLPQCPGWRETGRPRAALIATPAVWREGKLVAAPLAGRAESWQAERRGGAQDFLAFILSH